MESKQLPKYRSHKEVWALKIKAVLVAGDSGGHLVFEDSLFAPLDVSGQYVAKHKPKAGGYYVQYKDGYESWSPAKAFEEGYVLVDG